MSWTVNVIWHVQKWPESARMATNWHARAFSSFIVYISTGNSYFQVGKCLWPSGIVGAQEAWGPWFESCNCKRRFIRISGRHVRFFLLLPSDTSAQCFGAADSGTLLPLTKFLSTDAYGSPRPRSYSPSEDGLQKPDQWDKIFNEIFLLKCNFEVAWSL